MTGLSLRTEVVIVGASLSGAAAAKRLVDAGVDTIILERLKLPRQKVCSGILSPRGHRFLLENFGPLPRKVLHEPTSCKGVTFHFPSLLNLSMDFHGGSTPHLHRKYSDQWAIEQSGAEVMDETSFLDLEDHGGNAGVTVKARSKGKDITIHAKKVIGADGPASRVVKVACPDYHRDHPPLFMVGQKFHQIKNCPLDEDYFHFWFHPDLGHYTWSHARDGRQIVGVGFDKGKNFHEEHLKVARYLEEKHGVELEPAEETEGCGENFGPSLINRYVFGSGNVLVTGQAAGFLNMMAEGMSCALHSGAACGESIVEASRRNRPVEEVYREQIQFQVIQCSDQWNPFMIAFGSPHEADFRKELAKLPWGHRLKMLREIMSFMKIYKSFKWGRQMLSQSLFRLRKGRYDERRWY